MKGFLFDQSLGQTRPENTPELGVLQRDSSWVLDSLETSLKACSDPWTALQLSSYSNPSLWVVECPSETLRVDYSEGLSYFVCRERLAIEVLDMTKSLFDFARWCALQVKGWWPCPEVVAQWLETGDPQLLSQTGQAVYTSYQHFQHKAAIAGCNWNNAGYGYLAAKFAASSVYYAVRCSYRQGDEKSCIPGNAKNAAKEALQALDNGIRYRMGISEHLDPQDLAQHPSQAAQKAVDMARNQQIEKLQQLITPRLSPHQ